MARSYKSKTTVDFLLDELQVCKDKQIQVLLSERDKANNQVDLLGTMLIVAV